MKKPTCSEQTEWFKNEIEGKDVFPYGQLTSSAPTPEPFREEAEPPTMPAGNTEAKRQEFGRRETADSGIAGTADSSSYASRVHGVSTSGLGSSVVSSTGKTHVTEILLKKHVRDVSVI